MEIELGIIHEDKQKDYWNLKAHKGCAGSAIVGDIMDVEVMIGGSEESGYDLILRTGACGKDIIVPTAIATVATAGLATIPVALAENYRAHAFEKHFWDFIRKTTSEMGKERQRCLIL